MSQLTEDYVERAVRVGQRLGIALHEVHFDGDDRRVLTRPLDKRRG